MPTKPQPPTFGARLRSLRTEAGLSQYDLADRAGLTRHAIYLYERGQREPSLETARKLAGALGHRLACWE